MELERDGEAQDKTQCRVVPLNRKEGRVSRPTLPSRPSKARGRPGGREGRKGHVQELAERPGGSAVSPTYWLCFLEGATSPPCASDSMGAPSSCSGNKWQGHGSEIKTGMAAGGQGMKGRQGPLPTGAASRAS